LVTAAGRGIGRAVALALAAAGAEPLLVSRTQGELDEAAAEIVSGGGKAQPLPFDVTRSDAVRDALRAWSGSTSSSIMPASTGRNPFSRSTSRPSTCCSGSTSERRLSSPRPPPG
jgi:NAD(P)-dependent dehydrogenase (short-subunit alcohol dehydrogenase family)